VVERLEVVHQPAWAELVRLPLLQDIDEVMQPDREAASHHELEVGLVEIWMDEDVLVVG
jgi:hypothetical protein